MKRIAWLGLAVCFGPFLRHRGEAADVTKRFRLLTPKDKKAVLAFLESL